jgi:hypothetical protein
VISKPLCTLYISSFLNTYLYLYAYHGLERSGVFRRCGLFYIAYERKRSVIVRVDETEDEGVSSKHGLDLDLIEMYMYVVIT